MIATTKNPSNENSFYPEEEKRNFNFSAANKEKQWHSNKNNDWNNNSREKNCPTFENKSKKQITKLLSGKSLCYVSFHQTDANAHAHNPYDLKLFGSTVNCRIFFPVSFIALPNEIVHFPWQHLLFLETLLKDVQNV